MTGTAPSARRKFLQKTPQYIDLQKDYWRREGFEPKETLRGISSLLKSFDFLSPQIPFPPQSWQ